MGARSARRSRAAVALVALVALTGVACGDDGNHGSRAEAPPDETEAPPRPDEPMVIAHRGASAAAPEHTFAAYDLTLDQGTDYLELDLQMSADGELVVLHDDTLERTARGPAEECTGRVDAKTLAQLRECDVGTWFNEANPDLADPAYEGARIATMREVLDRYGPDVRYYIEIKPTALGAGMEQALVELLDEAGVTADAAGSRRVIVQSFSAQSLRTLHGLRPDLPLVLLLAAGAPTDPPTLAGVREYAVGIGPASVLVDAALVEAAQGACLDVHPYTVDDPAEMARLLDLGVDGVFTNRPDVLREASAGRDLGREPCDPPGAGRA